MKTNVDHYFNLIHSVILFGSVKMIILMTVGQCRENVWHMLISLVTVNCEILYRVDY